MELLILYRKSKGILAFRILSEYCKERYTDKDVTMEWEH